ncbi:hypothetical protein GDO86_017052 [Hymenochirus boettgeri]|uniref:Uncharacterized protein n=1 Tax=Hymenochirus boettgeri TaxID=247094 RepID=A0A8T2ILI1_9PIPI|nr:hypothetical protein GDO86_017052 [Hymenochirus boettgeri]
MCKRALYSIQIMVKGAYSHSNIINLMNLCGRRFVSMSDNGMILLTGTTNNMIALKVKYKIVYVTVKVLVRLEYISAKTNFTLGYYKSIGYCLKTLHFL